MNLLTWNINGILSKLEDPDFLPYIRKFEFVVLVETFVEFIDTTVFDGYRCFISPAIKLSDRGRRSGGIICLVKESVLNFIKPIECSYDNMLVFKLDRELFSTEKDILLLCVYIPPAGSPYYDLTDEHNGMLILEKCLEKFTGTEDCSKIVCGDFNARTGCYGVESFDDSVEVRRDMISDYRKSQDVVVNDYGHSLLSVCLGYDLCILNGSVRGDSSGNFTYISPTGNSVIDYFLVSKELMSYCKEMRVDANVLTAHQCLELKLECDGDKFRQSEDRMFATSRIVWDNRRQDVFVRNLQWNTERLDSFTAEVNVDTAAEDITECYVRAAEPFRRTVTYGVGHYGQPWFDSECRSTKKQLRSALRRYTRTLTMFDKRLYTLQRNNYKQLIRSKKIMYRKNLLTELVKNIHESHIFWKQIRKLNCGTRVRCRISRELWYDHFSNIFREPVVDYRQDLEYDLLVTSENCFDLNADITVEEVETAIHKLKTGRASGHDDIIAEMMKCTSKRLVVQITTLFNAMLEKGTYPTVWTKSVIVPIYKRGDPAIPDNYRGISLISTFSKVFTSILSERIRDWAEDCGILGEEQAGFRKGYSTTDNIFVLHSIIHRQLSRHRKLYAAFIDFRKAFDSINRDVLWRILAAYGMEGRLLRMLKAVYSNVQSSVRCEGRYSDSFACNRGLKQGCKMSPTIFSLLVNYVAKFVIKYGKHGIQLMPDSSIVYLLMFADDIVLVSDTVIGLQNQLENLKKSSDALGLEVNYDKTKTMVFRNGGHLATREKWYLGTNRLETVNEYRYLGSLFTSRLSFNMLQADLVQRAKGGLMQVNKCLRKLIYVSPNVYFKLIDAQVHSILLYSSEIWGMSDCSIVEAVHLQAVKRFLNLPIQSPNLMAYGETGRYPMCVNATIRAIKYWLKILKMDPSRYPHKVYKMMLFTGNRDTWAEKVKLLLYRLNLGKAWEDQNVHMENEFLKELKTNLVAEYTHLWSDSLMRSTRYEFYRLFKLDWGQENYLIALDKKVFRDVYVQFRTGFSELFTHKYRYIPDGHNNMLCPSCYESDESEVHFLLECPVYKDLRDKYIGDVSYAVNEVVVQTLFNTNDINSMRKVATFLYYALKRRSESVVIAMAEEAYYA